MATSDLDNELRQLFGSLMSLLSRFMKGESKKIMDAKTLLRQSKIPLIRLEIQRFPLDETDAYLTKALDRIQQIRQMGDSIFRSLTDEFIENGSQDEETGYPEDYDNITDSKANALHFLNSAEHELLLLKEDILQERATSNSVSTIKKVVEVKQLSFKYNFLNQRPADIANLYKGLIKSDLLQADSALIDFKKVFSGEKVTAPIRWNGSQSDLFHFIKQIHNVNKAVEPRTNDIWKITTHCFLNEEGKKYNVNWRSQKSPSSPDRRSMIDGIAARLKS